MIDKTQRESGQANSGKRRPEKTRFQDTDRLQRRLIASGGTSHRRSDSDNGQGGPPAPIGLDDVELEAALQNFVEPLIRLLEPDHAEVVWRAEILNQTPAAIAREMGFSEQAVTKYLKAGRHALLSLIMLALQQPIHE